VHIIESIVACDAESIMRQTNPLCLPLTIYRVKRTCIFHTFI